MRNCALPRATEDETWISEELVQAYTSLHKMGLAHSVEAWQDGILVGGLYGVSLGGAFFGESMFTTVSNASKVGFISLVEKLNELNFKLIDCQVYTQHLESLGAENVPRKVFSHLLKDQVGESPSKTILND